MSKKENVWNQLLFEKSRQGGFINKNLLILGRKCSGKRSLLDSLAEITKTLKNAIRQKGITPIVDYAYLNLIDLRDPDYNTNARLNVYILEEEGQKYLLPQILNHKNIKNTFVVIALDMQEPWTFMEDLDRWISVLQDMMADLRLSLNELEEMKSNVMQYMSQMDGGQVHEGLLKTNLGIPLMVMVNKSDILERDDKGKDWDQKAEIIQFCLRQFCVNYGATLLFTSVKQKINIKVMYEYVLHRLYNMPFETSQHKNLSDFESLFIPLGQDDINIIKSTFTKLANSVIKYEESVPVVQLKKNLVKEELTVEDDQEFFTKLKEKSSQAPATRPILPIQRQVEQPAAQQPPPSTDQPLSARGSQQSQQLRNFYDKILTGRNDAQVDPIQQAQQQLQERMKQRTVTEVQPSGSATRLTPLFNQQDQQRLQRILPSKK
ncbi:unnamed protein product [Paramecium primaurelia]|uniref:Dynein light intermediate chain n=1 Tax=Paramecium primaurelia TaxID=5886 RepID=A0A8S1Q7H2_PARPR|nr:unnamed protein product [Paramecium primaurelia]